GARAAVYDPRDRGGGQADHLRAGGGAGQAGSHGHRRRGGWRVGSALRTLSPDGRTVVHDADPTRLDTSMSTIPLTPLAAPKPADYGSDQDVRWCPGCGDYSILAQTKKVLAKLGVDRSKTVFISGIGCSSRFPYYMNTYGFHSIHGRAPTFVTGLKL